MHHLIISLIFSLSILISSLPAMEKAVYFKEPVKEPENFLTVELIHAINDGDTQAAKILLEAGADPFAYFCADGVSSINAICPAIKEGNTQILQDILHHPDAPTKINRSITVPENCHALHAAVYYQQTPILKMLLDSKYINPNYLDGKGYSAHAIAQFYKNIEHAQLLLFHVDDISCVPADQLILTLIEEPQEMLTTTYTPAPFAPLMALLPTLYRKKLMINQQNKLLNTPLHEALKATILNRLSWRTFLCTNTFLKPGKPVQFVKRFDERRFIDISVPFKQRCHAINRRGTHVCEFLLDHGANVSLRNIDRDTPLMTAAVWGSASLLELLLKKRNFNPQEIEETIVRTRTGNQCFDSYQIGPHINTDRIIDYVRFIKQHNTKNGVKLLRRYSTLYRIFRQLNGNIRFPENVAHNIAKYAISGTGIDYDPIVDMKKKTQQEKFLPEQRIWKEVNGVWKEIILE